LIQQGGGNLFDPLTWSDRGDGEGMGRGQLGDLRAKQARVTHHPGQENQRLWHLKTRVTAQPAI